MTGASRPIPAQVAYLSDGAEQRRSRRRVVNFAATLESEGTSAHPVQVLDLSEHGFRLSIQHEVAQGSLLLIKLPGTEALRARIVWARDGQVGCEFEEDLHPARIAVVQREESADGARPVQRRTQFGMKGIATPSS